MSPIARRIFQNATVVFVAFGTIGFSAFLGALAVIFYQVNFGDDSSLKRSTILAKINEETVIYTLDENTRIGSFFDSAHRRYVPIDDVPPHLINAFIASEDKNFYHHVGVDPMAIFSAFMDGIKEGDFRRGGSTITQQTVKNILDRREHTFKRKFREWIRALQLERLYSKREIMEFYLNQFHVAHNGNGVGIAAKYYFNKEVQDLNLVEAAFIAGSVKAPNAYNPFTKYTLEDRENAARLADQRKNYVIRRMYEQGWISKEQFEEAWKESVPFNKGNFQSREIALVDLIKNQVNRKEILEALKLGDISELNYAGLNIYTTIDIDMQEQAQLAMRRNLSHLETILNGFKAEDPQEFKTLRDLEVDEFYFGRVVKVVTVAGKTHVEMDFGFPKGIIPYESLQRYAKLMDIAIPTGEAVRMKELLGDLKVGDVLFVEVKEYDRAKHHAIVELHKRPVISGGMVALDKGEVRAVVSGFDPKGYNRAIFATRQPGSVFKSVVFFAALQLGWSILDRLDNERRLFPYQGQFYYPRPDHDSPYNEVSMVWAGAKSENLASIYLTAHLIDKLNLAQFKQVMGALGLLPEEGEAPRDFHYRVARKVGVQLDNEGIREYELQNAIGDLLPDVIFKRENDLMRSLRRMWWGRGYKSELQNIYKTDFSEMPEGEKELRLELARNNFQRHQLLTQKATEDWNTISERVSQVGAEAALNDANYAGPLSRFRVLSSGGKPALGYFSVLEGEELESGEPVPFAAKGRALNVIDIQAIWGNGSLFSPKANIALADVLLSGMMPLGYCARIQNSLEERYQSVMAVDETYDLVRYYHHHDFRIALGLNYLVSLTQAAGVFSKIEPVLSFPLGTNVVSVAEVAKIYQVFADGKTYRFYKDGPPNQLNFIRRIEDRFGNVLFEPERKEHQLTLPEYTMQMHQILRKVVTHGTGRRARGELYVAWNQGKGAGAKEMQIRIPAFGKTGTTNDYMTASFAGFIPYPTATNAPLDPTQSFVLATYVGYDLNRQMRRGGFKVGGALGALPAWTDLAKSIIDSPRYTSYLDKLDINILARQEWPLSFDAKSSAVKVDLARGLVLREADANDFEQFPTTNMQETGEIPINEFALDASVSSVVRMPMDPQNPQQVVRLVSPFTPEPPEGEEATTSVPSLVEPGAAAKIPDQQQVQGMNEPVNHPVPTHAAEPEIKGAEKDDDKVKEEDLW